MNRTFNSLLKFIKRTMQRTFEIILSSFSAMNFAHANCYSKQSTASMFFLCYGSKVKKFLYNNKKLLYFPLKLRVAPSATYALK